MMKPRDGRLTGAKIVRRVFMVSFFLVLAGIVVASLVSSLVFVRSMRGRMDAALIVVTNGLNKDIDSIVERMKVFGDVMGKWPHFINLVQRGNSTGMNDQLRSYIDVSSFASITVTDMRGYVLSRPHDPYRIGDNVSHTECVQRALQGEKVTTIEAGSGSSQWGIFHGAPIMRDGAVIGALVTEISLGDPAVLRKTGEAHGAQVTLYYDDMRINTTIEEHKNQFINTKAPAGVAEQVIDKGMNHFGELELAGGSHPHRVFYTPFVFEGMVVGMISAAISTKAMETDIRNAISLVAVAAVIFILMAASASYAFAQSVFRISEEKSKQDILLNLLMKHSPDTILIFDEHLKIINCCDIFLRRLRIGYLDQIAGRTIEEICAPFLSDADTRRVAEICRRSGEQNESVSFELTINLQWEEYPLSYNIHFTPMRDDNNNVIGFMALFHELTAFLRIKRVEAVSQAKSSFLAKVSHEMRTPLNAIIGLSEVEMRNSLPDGTRRNLNEIYASGTTLLALIDDILDISKIESGRFDLVLVQYDFPSMMNDVISQNVVRIGSKPVRFDVKLDPDIAARLYGDELRLKQILNNLLSNAFKYTDRGTVTLEISCERGTDDVWLTCIVSDTGRGIREKDLSTLFTEYSRIDENTNRQIEGTGLGLSICKKLVGLMGGTISVESEYGRGSSFTVRLRQQIINPAPIGEETAGSLRNFCFSEFRRSGKKIAHSRMPYGKVLVVDDVATNLAVAKGLMLPYGMTVHTVTGGQLAIDLIRLAQDRYDVIFMDHMMPDMDGVETVRVIRGDIGTDYAKNVPIVALTANAVAGIPEMLLQNGFNDFLSKPIDVVKLDEILNRFVRGRETGEPGSEPAMEIEAGPETEPEAGSRAADLLSRRLDGIDLEAGLRRFNGNAAAYLSILRSYVTHTSGLLDEIRAIPARETLSGYAVSVHGLKGASNSICAYEVGRIAEAIEAAAKKPDYEFVWAYHDAFISAADLLIGDLAGLLEDFPDGPAVREKKRAPDRELLARLRDACSSFKMNDIRRVIGELEMFSYETDSELVPWLSLQMENLDYDAMQRRLDEVLK